MKKVFLAMFAVAIAISGSAFTYAKKLAAGDGYGNDNASNSNYSKRTQPYNSIDCFMPDSTPCYYEVTLAGAPFVTGNNYSYAQLEAFLAQGYVIAKFPNRIYSGL